METGHLNILITCDYTLRISSSSKGAEVCSCKTMSALIVSYECVLLDKDDNQRDILIDNINQENNQDP